MKKVNGVTVDPSMYEDDTYIMIPIFNEDGDIIGYRKEYV